MPPIDQPAIIQAFLPQSKKRNIVTGAGIKAHSIIIFLSILDNPYCQGNYLLTTLSQALDTNNQLNVTCLLTDEVYWHNLKGLTNTAEEEILLKQRAINLGHEYLKNNLDVFLNVMQQYNPTFSSAKFKHEFEHHAIIDKIQNLNAQARDHNIPFQITTWAEWTADEDYIANRDDFNQLAISLPKLQGAFAETANSFAKRKMKTPLDNSIDTCFAECTNNEEKYALLKHRSLGYLAEECFALYFLAAKRGKNLIAYPGSMTKAFRETQQFVITKGSHDFKNLRIQVDYPKALASWIEIDKKTLEAAPASSQPQSSNSTEINSLASSGRGSPTSISPANIAISPVSVAANNMRKFEQQHAKLQPTALRRSQSLNPPSSKDGIAATTFQGKFFKSYENDTSSNPRFSPTPIIASLISTIQSVPPSENQTIFERFIEEFGVEQANHLANRLLEISKDRERNNPSV